MDSQGRQVKDTSKVNEDDDLGVNFGFLIDDDVELMEDYSDVTLGISPYKNDDRDMTSDPYSSGKYTKDLE